MLYAGCTDGGHNSTFRLMPTVYITSSKVINIICTIQSKLPASLTKANFPLSVLKLYWFIKQKLPVKNYCKSFQKKLLEKAFRKNF